MEYSKTYVFHPDGMGSEQPSQQGDLRGLQASWTWRKEMYQEIWRDQKKAIDATLQRTNETVVSNMSLFLDQSLEQTHSRIPTAFVLGGPDAASSTNITDSLSTKKWNLAVKRIFVNLSANSGSNLKSLLKVLIKTATSADEGIDDGEDEDANPASTTRKGTKLLNYDLQILWNHIKEQSIEQVVVIFRETEAFDGDVLSELIPLMSHWLDRIPFTFLFTISTSIELLQQRLSREAIKCVNGRPFSVAPAEEQIEQVFGAIISSDAPLKIGPNLAKWALERQSEYILNINSLVDAVHYAYMSHFYANALSTFLVPWMRSEDIPADHFEALRTLGSFRMHIEALLDADPSEAESLMESNEALHSYAGISINEGQDQIRSMVYAIDVIRILQTGLGGVAASTKSRLYIQAMAGTLAGSPLLRMILLSIRKAPSDVVVAIVYKISCVPFALRESAEFRTLSDALNALLVKRTDSSAPLRSEEDVRQSTLRTTVVAQKVELSKQKSTISKQDAAYTAIVRSFSDLLQSYFSSMFIDVKSLVFHELFIYDLRSPHREVFTPRPRHAVERALSTPHDYLDCDCCALEKAGGDEGSLAATQPATAILYQLYLESGSLINAADLLRAFQAVMGEGLPEAEIMALFQQALAELKYLGLVKLTRRRVDHIAKVAWQGL